jgi:4'-phosphopantetheinyl transferase EntD
MVMQHNSKLNLALGGGCSVASLESRELQDDEYTHHLSVGERAKYMGLPSQSRKSEWLAGRLAAKYLFLNRLEISQGTPGRQWSPALSKLSSEALGVYSPWMYQQVEVVTNGGKPSLAWCGQARPESISLSHSGSVSCASIAFGAPTVIDLETTSPRIDAFYRNNFTEAERAWAVRTADGEATKANWFFTLLWTLKESALKLGWLNSLWNLPRIEIGGLPGPNNIAPFWYSKTISNDFSVFTVSVKEHCRVMQVRVAVTGTRNFILTVMNAVGVVK